MLRFFLLAVLLPLAACVSPDQHESCAEWADHGECVANSVYMSDQCATSCDLVMGCAEWAKVGECVNNSVYMLEHCTTACFAIAEQTARDEKAFEGINSFFDLSALDIAGNVLHFNKFEGDVTILTNVASLCGFTDSHYKGLVQLWNDVKHTGRINLLAFPCNQFGAQEPKPIWEIGEFVADYGVEFTMMDKIDVNGPQASPVYKFLKREAGPSSIGWNFATYFIVGPDGSVQSHSGVEPMQLKDVALNLIASGGEL